MKLLLRILIPLFFLLSFAGRLFIVMHWPYAKWVFYTASIGCAVAFLCLLILQFKTMKPKGETLSRRIFRFLARVCQINVLLILIAIPVYGFPELSTLLLVCILAFVLSLVMTAGAWLISFLLRRFIVKDRLRDAISVFVCLGIVVAYSFFSYDNPRLSATKGQKFLSVIRQLQFPIAFSATLVIFIFLRCITFPVRKKS